MHVCTTTSSIVQWIVGVGIRDQGIQIAECLDSENCLRRQQEAVRCGCVEGQDITGQGSGFLVIGRQPQNEPMLGRAGRLQHRLFRTKYIFWCPPVPGGVDMLATEHEPCCIHIYM